MAKDPRTASRREPGSHVPGADHTQEYLHLVSCPRKPSVCPSAPPQVLLSQPLKDTPPEQMNICFSFFPLPHLFPTTQPNRNWSPERPRDSLQGTQQG